MSRFVRSATIVALLIFTISTAYAQKDSSGVLGKWKGESLCTVKPSACHDEVVVYDISAPPEKKGAGGGGGPNPFLVIGVALVAGIVLAKVIDWRGHAHPRW